MDRLQELTGFGDIEEWYEKHYIGDVCRYCGEVIDTRARVEHARPDGNATRPKGEQIPLKVGLSD
jgi:hypothetical protein